MRRWVPCLAALVALIWAGQPVLAIGPHQGTIGVAVQDFQFSPATVNVVVGDVVEWTWTGGAPHTVTADDGSFDSGILNNGATFSRAFSVPGEYRYYCTLHGASGGVGMAAIVNVQVGPTGTATAATDASASATPILATNTPTRTATAIATSTVEATPTPLSSITPAVPGPTDTPVVAPVSTRGPASAAGGAGALPRAGGGAEAASLRWRWIALAVIAFAMAGVAVAAGVRAHER